MKFGIFCELQLPRAWEPDGELTLYHNALDQLGRGAELRPSFLEHIMNLYTSLVRSGARRCRKPLAIRFCRPVMTCFPSLESRNINSLVVIPLVRGRDARGACERAGACTVMVRYAAPG